jgi:probable HAF family extracellular repeat protein
VPTFIADLTSATDINASGQVAGSRDDASGTTHGFLWENGVLTPLGSLDPQNKGDVRPLAIDDGGRVVGTSIVGGNEHAFVWTAATGMTELVDLGVVTFPFDVAATDINSAGWILGYAPNTNGQTDVLWGPDGSIREIAPLVPDAGPGKTWSQFFGARCLNDDGLIGGVAINSALGSDLRPVLLTPANLLASTLAPGIAGTLNTLQVSGATPGSLAILAADRDDALDYGYAPIAGCGSLGLAMKAPRVVASAPVDATGHATLTWQVPSSLAGIKMRVQVFQKSECDVSNVVRVTF